MIVCVCVWAANDKRPIGGQERWYEGKARLFPVLAQDDEERAPGFQESDRIGCDRSIRGRRPKKKKTVRIVNEKVKRRLIV